MVSKKFGTSIEVDGTIKAKQGTAAGEVVVLDSTGMIPADKVPAGAGGSGSGGTVSITVDSVLSATSTNPVQNKVIKAELDKKQPSGSYVKSGGLKTINGQSLEGSGDVVVSGGEINTTWAGKVVCVLGDSISTFKGYIPVADGFNEEHPYTYPGQDVKAWTQTWWGQIITALGAKLGINDSWSGSRVQNTYEADNPGGNVGAKVCMPSITRTSNLGSNGTPDLILFFGGTNDGKFSTFGEWDDTADHEVDLDAKTWASFQDAYAAAIMRLQYLYPTARVVTFCPMYVSSWYTDGKLSIMCKLIKEISDYFGCTCIDFRKCGITSQNITDYSSDGLHPNLAGMTLMADYALEQILTLKTDAGENVVYSVTNDLANAVTDMPHVKGVSAGAEYSATLNATSGITVHMGGKDITSSAFSGGVITIPSVTGKIVISDSGYVPPAVETYTVKFVNYDGTVLQTSSYEAGQTPVYTGSTPVKPSDASYSYAFSGWTPAIGIVTADATYTATFTSTPIDSGGDDTGDENLPSETVWYVDFTNEVGNYNYPNSGGAVTFSQSDTYSKCIGVPINAIKVIVGGDGDIGYGIVASDGDTYTHKGNITLSGASSTASSATPQIFKLEQVITLAEGERLAVMEYGGNLPGKIWVSTNSSTTAAQVRTNIRSAGTSKDENWKLLIGIGCVVD